MSFVVLSAGLRVLSELVMLGRAVLIEPRMPLQGSSIGVVFFQRPCSWILMVCIRRHLGSRTAAACRTGAKGIARVQGSGP
jgi:hypothetical protein